MSLRQYNSVISLFSEYWSNYGGTFAVVTSPYFHCALFLNILLWKRWLYQAWWEHTISIMPNIVGFTIGAYAILMAFGDDDFRRRISGKTTRDKNSPYMKINSTFKHFALVQITSIILALIGSTYQDKMPVSIWKDTLSIDDMHVISWSAPFSFVSYWSFLYAIVSVVAATAGIFRVAGWFDKDQTRKRQNDLRSKDVSVSLKVRERLAHRRERR
ncbi:hypothetical protein [Paramagnetospirillum magnetotacticum]|uniref:hypothetical protein n=1 Tax=Paramagnetospirillum magnetotacticum TaxID=188 RepID=UPI001269D0AF|nr:hypothetical protein [Paramagnetospirillum magnetotacticum]